MLMASGWVDTIYLFPAPVLISSIFIVKGIWEDFTPGGYWTITALNNFFLFPPIRKKEEFRRRTLKKTIIKIESLLTLF